MPECFKKLATTWFGHGAKKREVHRSIHVSHTHVPAYGRAQVEACPLVQIGKSIYQNRKKNIKCSTTYPLFCSDNNNNINNTRNGEKSQWRPK